MLEDDGVIMTLESKKRLCRRWLIEGREKRSNVKRFKKILGIILQGWTMLMFEIRKITKKSSTYPHIGVTTNKILFLFRTNTNVFLVPFLKYNFKRF